MEKVPQSRMRRRQVESCAIASSGSTPRPHLVYPCNLHRQGFPRFVSTVGEGSHWRMSRGWARWCGLVGSRARATQEQRWLWATQVSMSLSVCQLNYIQQLSKEIFFLTLKIAPNRIRSRFILDLDFEFWEQREREVEVVKVYTEIEVVEVLNGHYRR